MQTLKSSKLEAYTLHNVSRWRWESQVDKERAQYRARHWNEVLSWKTLNDIVFQSKQEPHLKNILLVCGTWIRKSQQTQRRRWWAANLLCDLIRKLRIQETDTQDVHLPRLLGRIQVWCYKTSLMKQKSFRGYRKHWYQYVKKKWDFIWLVSVYDKIPQNSNKFIIQRGAPQEFCLSNTAEANWQPPHFIVLCVWI